MAFDPSQFAQVVFSGGGIRCFWHGGFLSELGDIEAFAPQRISGVSGGALSGAAWIGGVETDLRAVMDEAFRHTQSNIAAGKSNYTPHEEVYRAVVETALDARAIERICDGPSFQIFLSAPPRWMPAKLMAALMLVAYKADQNVRSTPHLEWPRALGLQNLCVDARAAARQGTLVDLIVAAATIPPVFDVPVWEGRRVLDGGMHDKAPMPQPDEGRTFVLMTSRYDNCPDVPGRTYVMPSEAVAADKIDFTQPDKVQQTWDQGVRDAKSWLASGDTAD
ncbi:patatin-like phospholipase family protein [Paraurantiacibacter namhicola]|uniref:Patatin-like phospholipase n=1 Tax=Paraurantiacibacter namhicola TaxID=645517 RepID=A0A1C7DAG2_9SPHN|nr:patatin-like phospholipase family protein [Paraurantiacibacter namhicola]ANU08362.1 Patatin-like phospholipase [Paraurantiacibacter namhicola]